MGGGGSGGQRTGGGGRGNSHRHTWSWADGAECSYSIGKEDAQSRDDGEDEGPGSPTVASSALLGFSSGFAFVDAAGGAAEGVEDLEGRQEDEGLDDGVEEGEEEAEEEESCCPVCLEDLTAFNHLHLATCTHILCGEA